MANEISLTASLGALKQFVTSTAIGRAVAGLSFTWTSNAYIEGTMLVPITNTVIPLGQVTNPHWAFFYNLDLANYIALLNGASGNPLIKLLAGECAFVPLNDAAVPYAQANAAACQMEYLILGL
jgi:hypothetical protein